MERNIIIIYRLKINTVEFTGISLHTIDVSQDMFVFANDYIQDKGAEKIFNAYFTDNGLLEIQIKEVRVLPDALFKAIGEIIK